VFLEDFCQASSSFIPSYFFQITSKTVTIFPIDQSSGQFYDLFNGVTIGLPLSSMFMDLNVEKFLEKALGQASNVLSAYFD
jgi:hypothetical protein